MSLGDVTIKAALVPYLRKGVKEQMSAAIAVLDIELRTVLDPETYDGALTRFHEASELLDTIGTTDEPPSGDLQLDLDRWPRLLQKVLESEYDAEAMHLQDLGHEGFTMPLHEIPALRSLVSAIRNRLGAPPKRRRTKSLGEQARRRSKRSCGRG